MPRPNVLFICCDDLNDAVSGFGGHPQAQTPHLDELCRRGLRFTNAQCNVPLCGPSRASFLSGIAPWVSGYTGYCMPRAAWTSNPMLANSRTFMEHFAAHGYRVYGTGKIFHNGEEKPEVWTHGHGHAVDWGPWSWDGISPGGGWPSCAGHQDLPAGWGPEMLFAPLSAVPDIPPDPTSGAPGHRGWRYGNGRPFRYHSDRDRDPMPDEMNADWACQILADQQGGEPFLLCVGIGRPHVPLVVPDQYFDLFPLAHMELAPVGSVPDRDVLDFSDACWGRYKYELHWQAGGETMLRRWTQAYLASVAFADAQIGRILAAVDAAGHRDDTVIIVTSDNGYHMGEKQWLFKYSPWEEANRVPLIISGPGIQADRSCAEPVSLLDLYPSFCQLCDLDPEPHRQGSDRRLDGCSLVPLFSAAGEAAWDGPLAAISMVSSSADRGPQLRFHRQAEHYSLRSRTHRYILYADGREELYDHRDDPHEWQQCSANPTAGSVRQQLRQYLTACVGR